MAKLFVTLSDLLQRLVGLASKKAIAPKVTRAVIIIEWQGRPPLRIDMENVNLYETQNHSGQMVDIGGVRRLVPKGTWTISITGERAAFSRKPLRQMRELEETKKRAV